VLLDESPAVLVLVEALGLAGYTHFLTLRETGPAMTQTALKQPLHAIQADFDD
jgi:hypothetical protein